MSQQLAIIVLVDVGTALSTRTLRGNTYLFDNMKLQGSVGEGTGDLVTAINGSHWVDGSQAGEQVLNWLPYALGSIPPTVPHDYHADRVLHSDRKAIAALGDLATRIGTTGTDLAAELDQIHQSVGAGDRALAAGTGRRHPHGGGRILDITGNVVSGAAAGSGEATHNHPTPVIIGITGEAVDEKIMYPAQYGSPDMLSDGWYWSASVDSSRPGTYAYTMTIELHELVRHGDGDWRWEPVHLTCESSIRVTTAPRRNGFTGGGIAPLPVIPLPGVPAV